MKRPEVHVPRYRLFRPPLERKPQDPWAGHAVGLPPVARPAATRRYPPPAYGCRFRFGVQSNCTPMLPPLNDWPSAMG
jgi:hypothetical protein